MQIMYKALRPFGAVVVSKMLLRSTGKCGLTKIETVKKLVQKAKRSSSISLSADSGEVESLSSNPTVNRRKRRRKEKTPRIPQNLSLLREKGEKISSILKDLYPTLEPPLKHQNSFQLLVAVLLSAQCTDKIVNKCTPNLFKRASDAKEMAALKEEEILEYIKTVNYAPTKAKNVSKLSQTLVDVHYGEVPSTFEDLEALPGVGHKTASVVMIHAFGKDAFPVDTHIHRLAQRWGLSTGKSVVHTEEDLKMIFPQEEWKDIHLRIILFGREYCPARGHDLKACAICSWANKSKQENPETEKPPLSVPMDAE